MDQDILVGYKVGQRLYRIVNGQRWSLIILEIWDNIIVVERCGMRVPFLPQSLEGWQ